MWLIFIIKDYLKYVNGYSNIHAMVIQNPRKFLQSTEIYLKVLNLIPRRRTSNNKESESIK